MQRHQWTADIVISVDLAREVIAEQFPQFKGLTIAPLGEGWDNAAFVVDGRTVFRFPRREIAVELIELEAAVLPRVEQSLPLPISAPHFVGKPCDRYPRPFAGYPILPGEELARVDLDAAQYVELATVLGTFLRALHAMDVERLVEAGLPGDKIGRMDHARRMPQFVARAAELREAGIDCDFDTLAAFLESVAPAGVRADRACLVHGDLYARHILIDGGRASGVIDWGDAHAGDPAIDLSVMYGTLPPGAAREAFVGAYGQIDEETQRLARYRAIYSSLLVAHYGRAIGDEAIFQAGMRGLGYETN